MRTVEISHLVKTYRDKTAVNDVSFTVDSGEIFGLIGPNGAGKSTTIRTMMGIIRPDSGSIAVLGEPLSELSKNNVGYLPEERGLYKKLRVYDTILYLASLKGMSKRIAEKRADELLDKTGMMPHKNKKIEELSKGMTQLIQFIVTVVHDPMLVVLDEPFSGLDPANAELLKSMIDDLRSQGKAVIMSTHRMNEVEELCDRLLMINKGQAVLYGSLMDIKKEYSDNSIHIEYTGELGDLPGVISINADKGHAQLNLEKDAVPQKILEVLVNQGLQISRFEIAEPVLNDIFLKIVGETHE